MSLLAGFDKVVEISRDAFLRVIKANGKLKNGRPLSPPFDINLPLNMPGLGAGTSFYFVVKDIVLDLIPGTNQIKLTLKFDSGQVFSSSGAAVVSDIYGDLAINTSLNLVEMPLKALNDLGLKVKVIRVDLASANPQLWIPHNVKQAITQKLWSAGLQSVTVQQLESAVGGFLADMIRTIPPIDYPKEAVEIEPNGSLKVKGFLIREGVDGDLKDPLFGVTRFTALNEIRCVGSPAGGVLAIFGLLLTSTQGANANQKTAAIPALRDISISISAEAFKRLIFCPGAAESLLKRIEKEAGRSLFHDAFDIRRQVRQFMTTQMPGCCGPGGGLKIGDATLTHLCCSFNEGFIRVDGSLSASGFCFEATGTFYQKIALSIKDDNQLAATVIENPPPNVTTSIDWYCEVFIHLLFDFAIVGIAINAIIAEIAEDIAEDLAEGQNKPQNLKPSSPGVMQSITFKEVTVNPEGLRIDGTLKIDVPPPLVRKLELFARGVQEADPVLLNSGIYHFPGRALGNCEPRDFPYSEYGRQQTFKFEAIASNMVSFTPKIEFWLEYVPGLWGGYQTPGPNSRVALVPTPVDMTNSTGVQVRAAEKKFPLPLEAGTTLYNEEVSVGYRVIGNTVTLQNIPTDGNYTLRLRARATDSDGGIAEANTSVSFTGNAVEIGGGYKEFMDDCIAKGWKVLERVGNLTQQRALPQLVPTPGDPAPDGLPEFILGVAESGLPDAVQLLATARLRYGAAFDRALESLAKRKS